MFTRCRLTKAKNPMSRKFHPVTIRKSHFVADFQGGRNTSFFRSVAYIRPLTYPPFCKIRRVLLIEICHIRKSLVKHCAPLGLRSPPSADHIERSWLIRQRTYCRKLANILVTPLILSIEHVIFSKVCRAVISLPMDVFEISKNEGHPLTRCL